MFERTRIKLTSWYLLIIMVISLLFSLIIYSMVNIEFIRFEENQIRLQENMIKNRYVPAPREGDILFVDVHEARIRLITRLGLLNLGILVFAGGAGYFLAGRTLRPIKDSMDEQNRFISDSSHELRTPLTSLRSEIEVSLMDKKLTVLKAKNILKSNLEDVISLQALSDRLLELAEGKEILNSNNMTEISILELIQNVIKKTKKMAKLKQIKITVEVKDRTITGDFERLSEAFVILIDNAVKYSPKKSKIEIFSENSRNHAVIKVQDFGMGISEEDITYIFNRFYRTQRSRTESGYGLGLSIAKKIIDEHGGSLSAESTIKKGSTFLVRIPS